jgi:hypothetical protein
MTDWPNPFPHQAVCDLPLSHARVELLEEIMSTPVLDQVDRAAAPRRTPPRWLAAAGAAAAVVATVSIPLALDAVHEPAGRPGSPAASGGVAADARRAVLDQPGWTVEHVSETADDGQIEYASGGRRLSIMWRTGALYQTFALDRQAIGPSKAVELLGLPSRQWAYDASDHTTIRPVQNGSTLEVRGSGMDEAAYRTLLGELRLVDDAGFAAALPESVVTPGELRATVARMLADVPVPLGFDQAELGISGFNTRFYVGAGAVRAVVCAWVEVYAGAPAKASAALSGARDWVVLQELAVDGSFAEFVHETADLMRSGEPAAAVKLQSGCAAAETGVSRG